MGLAYHLAIDGIIEPAPYKDLPVGAPMEVHQTLFAANAAAEAVDVSHKTSLSSPAPSRSTSPGAVVAKAAEKSSRMPGGQRDVRTTRPRAKPGHPVPPKQERHPPAPGGRVRSPPVSKPANLATGSAVGARRAAVKGLSIQTILREGEAVHGAELVEHARQHARLLSVQFTVSAKPKSLLSRKDVDLLQRFGTWLHALHRKQVPLLTDEQKHFHDVALGRSEPETEFERVWLRYLRAARGLQPRPPGVV